MSKSSRATMVLVMVGNSIGEAKLPVPLPANQTVSPVKLRPIMSIFPSPLRSAVFRSDNPSQ